MISTVKKEFVGLLLKYILSSGKTYSIFVREIL